MRDRTLWLVVGTVVLFIGLLAMQMARYRECREHGFSVFYCMTQR